MVSTHDVGEKQSQCHHRSLPVNSQSEGGAVRYGNERSHVSSVLEVRTQLDHWCFMANQKPKAASRWWHLMVRVLLHIHIGILGTQN